MAEKHYLEDELEQLIVDDISMWHFLQEGSLDGVWYWDLENPNNEWMSPQFWQLFGYDFKTKKHDPAEWQGMIFEEDLKLALDNFNRHCADPTVPYDQVVRYRHKDGSTVWVRCRGVAVRDNNGKPIRMLGAHNDLTAVKEAERQAIERADLLKVAYEEAHASNEELRAFSFGVSHDLKSPTNTMLMILNEILTEKENLSEKQLMLIESGLGMAERMRTLVEELTDYTHLIGEEVEKDMTDLAVVLAHVLHDIKSDLTEANAKIVVEDLPKAHANSIQMRILLQNLISNAVKYRRKGVRPEVVVKGFVDETCAHVGFSVSDNGIGIDQSQHDNIFNLFKRLHRYDQVPGTGLGLTICKRILINHGGQIELHSAPNQGSRFTCRLPANV